MSLNKVIMYREDGHMNGYLNKRPGKDAGYDLYAAETKWFWPLQTRVVNSNGRFHVPAGLFARITSRSGHGKKGWITIPGTIDNGYTGAWGIVQVNLSLLPRRIKKGTRIAQAIFVPFVAPEIEEAETHLEYTQYIKDNTGSSRGNDGFGSSGEI